jgi:hypothetical protein
MPILGFCADAFRAVINIDFQPLGLKSDHIEGGGGFWGLKLLKFKSLHFHYITNLSGDRKN